MPVTYRIDGRANLIRTVGWGDVTPDEVHAHFNELARAWPPLAKLDVLLDLSGCTSIPDLSQLRDVVSHIKSLGGDRRFGTCAVVASRELLYGLMRVFEFLADESFAAIRVFRNEAEAVEWLREQSSAVRQNM